MAMKVAGVPMQSKRRRYFHKEKQATFQKKRRKKPVQGTGFSP